MLIAAVVVAVAAVFAGAPAAPRPSGASDQRAVVLHAGEETEDAAPAPVVDRLADGDVLRVTVDGGRSGARAHVGQCRQTVAGFASCHNEFPVLFDDEGVAIFQYQLTDRGGCGGAGRCVVVVSVEDDDRPAYAYLVFGEAAPPPPTMSLQPAGPYDPGDRVVVSIDGLTPGADVEVAFCSAQGCDNRVGALGDDGGHIDVTITIGGRCPACGIRVVSGPSAKAIAVTFTPAPSPRHTPLRLAIGLVAAAILVLLAWWLIATMDWRPPSEASTPEFDTEPLA